MTELQGEFLSGGGRPLKPPSVGPTGAALDGFSLVHSRTLSEAPDPLGLVKGGVARGGGAVVNGHNLPLVFASEANTPRKRQSQPPV